MKFIDVKTGSDTGRRLLIRIRDIQRIEEHEGMCAIHLENGSVFGAYHSFADIVAVMKWLLESEHTVVTVQDE